MMLAMSVYPINEFANNHPHWTEFIVGVSVTVVGTALIGSPFFNCPLDIRKAIYTTNSVESLNRSLRKIIKPAGIPQ